MSALEGMLLDTYVDDVLVVDGSTDGASRKD
jgi:hypothetical protein